MVRDNKEKTTTASKLARSLDAYVDRLSDVHKKLQQEKTDIRQGVSEIQEERDVVAAAFLEKEITALEGEEFDRLNKLSEEVPELSSASLAFTRDKILKTREQALEEFSEQNEGRTYSVQRAHEKVAETRAQLESTRKQAKPLRDKVTANAAEQAKWKATTAFRLLTLEEDIISKGGKPLDQNNDYINPKTGLSRMVKLAFGGPVQREVWRILDAMGHDTKDKNILQRLPRWRSETKRLNVDAIQFSTSLMVLEERAASEKQHYCALDALAKNIPTDGEIVQTLREKALPFFANKSFVDAAAKEYGESFPTSLPLLLAKSEVLGKLEEGVETKLEALWDHRKLAKKQYEKVEKVRCRQSSYKLPVDLEKLEEQQKSNLSVFSKYQTSAERSRSSTMTYAPSSSNQNDSSSSGFFEGMLLMHLLTPSSESIAAPVFASETVNLLDQAVPDLSETFTASLLGIDSEKAVELGFPDSFFPSLPDLSDGSVDFAETMERNINFGIDTSVAESLIDSDTFKNIDFGSSSDVFDGGSSFDFDSGSSFDFGSDF